jgi:Flp pilus assembly protein TadD
VPIGFVFASQKIAHETAEQVQTEQATAPEARSTAEYHNLAGSVAAALHWLAEAETHFSKAARLEPSNPIPRMD